MQSFVISIDCVSLIWQCFIIPYLSNGDLDYSTLLELVLSLRLELFYCFSIPFHKQRYGLLSWMFMLLLYQHFIFESKNNFYMPVFFYMRVLECVENGHLLMVHFAVQCKRIISGFLIRIIFVLCLTLPDVFVWS